MRWVLGCRVSSDIIVIERSKRYARAPCAWASFHMRTDWSWFPSEGDGPCRERTPRTPAGYRTSGHRHIGVYRSMQENTHLRPSGRRRANKPDGSGRRHRSGAPNSGPWATAVRRCSRDRCRRGTQGVRRMQDEGLFLSTAAGTEYQDAKGDRHRPP